MTHIRAISPAGHSIVRRLAATSFAALVTNLATMYGGAVAGPPQPAPAVAAAAAPVAALPGWHDDDLRELDRALEAQCRLKRPPRPWTTLCAQWRERGDLRAWIESRFEAVALADANGSQQGLVTGYYEPVIGGTRERRAPGQVALYRRPPAQVLGTRPTRAAIEESAMLAGSELVWIDDPVEAFFLHVQGSGRVRMPDGTTMRVGYAANNGQPYRAIGRILVERGALRVAQADTAGLKRWLRENPDEARAVMRANPRYIFFRELAGDSDAGPPGSLGVPLTPMRSVAVDPARIAPGSMLFLATTHPTDGGPIARVVLAQDTGGAITGPLRIDLFWGRGDTAGDEAGAMRHPGRVWLLRPRD